MLPALFKWQRNHLRVGVIVSGRGAMSSPARGGNELGHDNEFRSLAMSDVYAQGT
jgi:hypothetical protein